MAEHAKSIAILLCRPLFIWLCLVLFFIHTSCTPNLLAPLKPLPKQEKATLGVIAVVAARFHPKTKVDRFARNRLLETAKAAGMGFLEWAGTAAGAFSGGSCEGGGELGAAICGAMLIFAFAVVVAAGTVGALSGAAKAAPKAIPAEEAKKIQDAAREALEDLNIQESITNCFFQKAQEQTQHRFVSLKEDGPTATDQKVDYSKLSRDGIDTVLEVGVVEIGFQGEGVDPALQLFITVRTRLIRVEDGKILYDRTQKRYGQIGTLAYWETNNCQPFRDALEWHYRHLAVELVEALFSQSSIPKTSMVPAKEIKGQKS
jgi:hypothetical protein